MFPTANSTNKRRLPLGPIDSDVPSSSNQKRSRVEVQTNAGASSCKTEVVSDYLTLYEISPSSLDPLNPLSSQEMSLVEACFGIGVDESWRGDWIGNLSFVDQEVVNPDVRFKNGIPGGAPKAVGRSVKKPLIHWAEFPSNSISRKILRLLLRYVYNLSETPARAKSILSHAVFCQRNKSDKAATVEAMRKAVRRVSYDPVVLSQDGWDTRPSDVPIGASGGPFRIGQHVVWQNYEGVVIAYIHDNDLGDLWKAMWLDGFDTFDLEVEELEKAKRKYERRQAQLAGKVISKKQKKEVEKTEPNSLEPRSSLPPTLPNGPLPPKGLGRQATSADISVTGIEFGVVLATSYSRGSRKGVFWPARIMHASEMSSYGVQNKRGTQKHKIMVVFLSPYWNSESQDSGGSVAGSGSRHNGSLFHSGPLFQMETLDVTGDDVQEYPHDPSLGLNFDTLRVSFRLTGLPKAAFSRYVDSHRLAMGLKAYAQSSMGPRTTDVDKTTANLFEAHKMSVQTPLFPLEVLHLPFEYILSQLEDPPEKMDSKPSYDERPRTEPALQLRTILDSMKPPVCFGGGQQRTIVVAPSAQENGRSSPIVVHDSSNGVDVDETLENQTITAERFLTNLDALQNFLADIRSSITKSILSSSLTHLCARLPQNQTECQELDVSSRRIKAKAMIDSWVLVKTHGEELIVLSQNQKTEKLIQEWRRACERVFKYIVRMYSTAGFGRGVSAILTDSLCNGHITSYGCFERPVRLPAAIKAVKEIGAGTDENIPLVYGIDQEYLDLAENFVIGKAHSKSYVKKMREKCKSIKSEKSIVALTEDSDGKGGEDTMGSKGTWMAAIAGVGASIKAVDMILHGECSNVFCITRPPGHHAGRKLHAMKAVSNGFCILNTAACAALYATTPQAENGPGLKRVCVIDIDVHHGNGTQDILCHKHDPRFLYVSVHAGGEQVNGVELGADDSKKLRNHLGRSADKGIYPGRCGDISPHAGVLNIPLGAKVTAHAVGTALLTKVTPAVERFSPELIIISTGFDAHKNDPLGLGGLRAEDFGTVTEIICGMALRMCSGRVLSVLEGGYGVPCCRPQIPSDQFLPQNMRPAQATNVPSNGTAEGSSLDVAIGKFDGAFGDKNTTAQGEKTASAKEESPHAKKMTMDGHVPAATGEEACIDPSSENAAMAKETAQSKVGDVPETAAGQPEPPAPSFEPTLLDLEGELPEGMPDKVPEVLQRRLERCHAEGFMHCVQEHVRAIIRCNDMS